jgi:hypothetical protein
MSEPKTPPQQPRQVTVQPQEPAPPKGGAPKEPEPKSARKTGPGQQDKRSGGNRDGNE